MLVMKESRVMQVLVESLRHETTWLCEKWSEEAVEFGRHKADRLNLTHLPAELCPVQVFKGGAALRKIFIPRLMPVKHGLSSAALRALVGDPEECTEIAGNMLVNEGIQRLQDMTMVATVVSNQVATNPWSNTNAYTGVGDSNTAEAATQTELQAATNRFYKAMNATYPSRSSQTVSFQSDFTTTEANYVWAEWTVAAGATTASGAGFTTGTTNLNRKVAALGTKASGTWTLTAQITFS
jgi:hypothetical protein